MLEVENLCAGYGRARILHDVSVRVGAGEIVAVLGSNGAGKTTLFRSLFGFTDVESGGIRFADLDLRGTPAFEIARAGLVHVPEGRGIFPGMTVLENLMVPVHADRRRLTDRRDTVFEIFPKLQARIGQAAGTMSGGEQQMLAIARALMSEPVLLMLDEPSLGLAPKIVGELFATIKQLREENITVLLVEQNATAALTIADRAYVLENGKIMLSGPAAEVLANPEIKRMYLGG